MSASPRVLHLIAPGPIGGAETVVLGLVEALRAVGVAASIAAIVEDLKGAFLAESLRRDLEVVAVISGGRRYIAQTRRIVDAARERRIDVIHTHGYHADVIGMIAGGMLGVPVVCTLHGFTGEGLRTRLYDMAAAWAHRHADAVVAVSEPILEQLLHRGVKRDRTVLITNALVQTAPVLGREAARRALGIPEGGVRIGWVGRLSPEKGPDILLAAAALLRGDDVSFSIVGDGPMRSDLDTRCRSLGLSGAVTFHGVQPAAGTLLSAFDVLVLSSRSEGTPMVLLEAMWSHTPIVATAVGGVALMLGNEEAALVPPERPELLARALRLVLSSPTEARRRSHAAHARLVRQHDPTSWALTHQRLYERVRQSV